MGIGCRRDPLEANVWYVKAADQGDERAKHRISAIRAAASGSTVASSISSGTTKKSQTSSLVEDKAEGKAKAKRWHLF